jgi:hypothetical protein
MFYEKFLSNYKSGGSTLTTRTPIRTYSTPNRPTDEEEEDNFSDNTPPPTTTPTSSNVPSKTIETPPPTTKITSTPPPTQTTSTEGSSSDSTAAVKNIMNQVFRKAKGKVTNETTYNGGEVIDIVKGLIVETTLQASSGSPNEVATIKSIMNSVFKTIKSSFQLDDNYSGENVLDSIKGAIIKITNELLNTSTSQTQSNTPTQSQKIERVDSRSMGSSSDGTVTAGIEVQRREADVRINKNPTEKDVDLTDPDILDYYIRIRNDSDNLTWVIWDYGSSKNRLQLYKSGGDFNELKDNIPDGKPVYVYFKYHIGDTKRARFVFMTYVPESLNGIQKSRVLGHRPSVEEFIKYMQMTLHIQDTSDFDEESLRNKLVASSGANYSVQEKDKGNFTNYKTQTKSFYSETEKRGNVKIAYDENRPLSLTPCDISGRPTVAPTTQFLNNTSTGVKSKN